MAAYDEVFTVHVRLSGDWGTTHTVDVEGKDTVGTVLEKVTEVLRVEGRHLTLLHDGTPLDDLTQGVTETTLYEGSEVEARVKEPTVVRLLSDDVREEAEAAVSASPDGTLYLDVCGAQGTLDLGGLSFTCQRKLRHLILCDTDPEHTHITSIGSQCLRDAWKVETADFTLLTEVVTIEGAFLSRTCIESLNLSPLVSVRTVGDSFLSGCASLTALQLPPNVMCIGPSFLRSCTSLRSLDLSPLSGVADLSNYFLLECSSLETLDLSPLSQVASVGDKFLWACSSLNSIDLSPLSRITSIEWCFLGHCSSLAALDLSPLSGVTSVASHFLADCTSLQALDLSALSKITCIESFFLRRCSSLRALDLSPLSRVTCIESHFLHECSSLAAIDLSPLSNVDSVGSYCLAGCGSLQTLDLSPLSRASIHCEGNSQIRQTGSTPTDNDK